MKVQHLVVDANAFINFVQLQELGENIYTTREVIGEIRDNAARKRLEVLPYEIKYLEPSVEHLQLITKLSKVTGDFASLSAVDIQVMALAYELTKDKLGPDKAAQVLKTELDVDSLKRTTVLGGHPQTHDFDSKNDFVPLKNSTEDANIEPSEESTEAEEPLQENPIIDDQSESENSEESEDDDESGWITPSNLKSKLKELSEKDGQFEDIEDLQEVPVACLTNDFAMQNLMMHIGIRVLSSNGMLVKQLRTYILRCYTCFQTTSKMEKLFCPKCGNKTLKRVSVTVNPDGSQVLHLSRRVNLTGKGKRFPLPAPKGGKHANNPVLYEDQPIPQQRPTKQALKKFNPLDFEYVAGNSPFVTRDIYSRAGVLGINYGGSRQYWDKKNPNEVRKGTGKNKSRKAKS